jgi:hypothetical protein
MATQIKQWVTAQDGLDKLRLTTSSMPEPKDGEVLVKVNAVSLNYRDTEGMLEMYIFMISVLIINSDHGVIQPPQIGWSSPGPRSVL